MKTIKDPAKKLGLVATIIASLAAATDANATGWSVGNGGHVWQCRQGDRVTYELVDHYEARTAHGGTPANVRGDWKTIAREKLETMRAHAPGLTDEMIARIDRFEDDAQFLRGTDVPLPFVNDSYNFIAPRGCRMRQLALNRSLVGLSSEKTYYIDETIWNRLPDVQKAMTAVHEVLYTDSLRHQAHSEYINSAGVRALNAELFLDRISELPRLRWEEIAYREASLRVPYMNVYPSGISGVDTSLAMTESQRVLYFENIPLTHPGISVTMFGTNVTLLIASSRSTRSVPSFRFDVTSIDVPLPNGNHLSLRPLQTRVIHGREVGVSPQEYAEIMVHCPSWPEAAHGQLARLLQNEGSTECFASTVNLIGTFFSSTVPTSHLLPSGALLSGFPGTLQLRCRNNESSPLCTTGPILHRGFELPQVTVNLSTGRIQALAASANDGLRGLSTWLSSLTERPVTCARINGRPLHVELTVDENGQVEIPDYCQEDATRGMVGPNARISPISDTPIPPPSSGRNRHR